MKLLNHVLLYALCFLPFTPTGGLAEGGGAIYGFADQNKMAAHAGGLLDDPGMREIVTFVNARGHLVGVGDASSPGVSVCEVFHHLGWEQEHPEWQRRVPFHFRVIGVRVWKKNGAAFKIVFFEDWIAPARTLQKLPKFDGFNATYDDFFNATEVTVTSDAVEGVGIFVFYFGHKKSAGRPSATELLRFSFVETQKFLDRYASWWSVRAGRENIRDGEKTCADHSDTPGTERPYVDDSGNTVLSYGGVDYYLNDMHTPSELAEYTDTMEVVGVKPHIEMDGRVFFYVNLKGVPGSKTPNGVEEAVAVHYVEVRYDDLMGFNFVTDVVRFIVLRGDGQEVEIYNAEK